MKAIKEKKSWKDWGFEFTLFKPKEDYDRNIFPVEKFEEKIIMIDEPTKEEKEQDIQESAYAEATLLEEPKPERHETSTNDDLRMKRKKNFFVSGEDYEALERELEARNWQLDKVKKRIEDVEKALQEIKKILV